MIIGVPYSDSGRGRDYVPLDLRLLLLLILSLERSDLGLRLWCVSSMAVHLRMSAGGWDQRGRLTTREAWVVIDVGLYRVVSLWTAALIQAINFSGTVLIHDNLIIIAIACVVPLSHLTSPRLFRASLLGIGQPEVTMLVENLHIRVIKACLDIPQSILIRTNSVVYILILNVKARVSHLADPTWRHNRR